MYDILKYNSAQQHPQIYCTNVCANVTDMYDKCTHEAETAATLCCACVEEHNPHASAPRQPLQHTKTLWSACANPSLMISFSASHVIAKVVINWYRKTDKNLSVKSTGNMIKKDLTRPLIYASSNSAPSRDGALSPIWSAVPVSQICLCMFCGAAWVRSPNIRSHRAAFPYPAHTTITSSFASIRCMSRPQTSKPLWGTECPT